LLYADDANINTPNGLQKLMDYIHTWLNKCRTGDEVFSPQGGESCSVPAKDRRNAWTWAAHCGQQVWYQRMYWKTDHGSTRAKALAKMQAAYGYWNHCCHAAESVLPTKVRLLMVQTFIYPRSCMARKCGTHEGGQRQDVSGRKALRSILAHPETALLTFCTGTLGYFHLVYSLMLPVLAAQMQTWRLADGPRRLRFSFEGSRGVGRPKVGTDWCGNVKSITEQIQHT
jgi:hypothetical protein